MNKIFCYYASILCLMNVYQESSLILEEKLIDFLFQKKKIAFSGGILLKAVEQYIIQYNAIARFSKPHKTYILFFSCFSRFFTL